MTTLNSLIRVTVVDLRAQAATYRKILNGDLVMILKSSELDEILKRIIGWIDNDITEERNATDSKS